MLLLRLHRTASVGRFKPRSLTSRMSGTSHDPTLQEWELAERKLLGALGFERPAVIGRIALHQRQGTGFRFL